MSEIVSKGEFAALRGVSPSAVSNWINRGKLSGAALTDDDRIVVEEACRQLGVTIDPGRGAPPPALAASADPAPGTLAAVRLRKEVLAVEEAEQAAAIRRGELVDAQAAAKRWAAELEELLGAVELFITELPPRLGLARREEIDEARRLWREFRARRAAQQAEIANAV